MNRKQIYTLIGMGLLMLVILVGVMLAVNFNNGMSKNRDTTQSMINALQATTDAQNAGIGTR